MHRGQRPSEEVLPGAPGLQLLQVLRLDQGDEDGPEGRLLGVPWPPDLAHGPDAAQGLDLAPELVPLPDILEDDGSDVDAPQKLQVGLREAERAAVRDAVRWVGDDEPVDRPLHVLPRSPEATAVDQGVVVPVEREWVECDSTTKPLLL